MYKRNMQIQIEKKDKIIVLLIVLMFLEAIVCYAGFVYYESQFDYVEHMTRQKMWTLIRKAITQMQNTMM